MNILVNRGLEAEWTGDHRCLVISDSGSNTVDIDNINCPPGWTVWFVHDGAYAQPEGRDARAKNPDRMRSGEKGYVLFTFGRRHWAGLKQTVGAEPGCKVRFSAWAHAWSNHKDLDRPDDFPHPDDPFWSEGAGYDQVAYLSSSLEETGDPQQDARANMAFDVGIDPAGGDDPFSDDVVWSEQWCIYNGYVKQLEVEVEAQAEQVTVFTRSHVLYPFKHCDADWDDLALDVILRGAPRVQYKRIYVLLPPSSRARWARAVVDATWNDHRYTIGSSADDAGIGDLDERLIVAVNPGSWPSDFYEFIHGYYAGVKVLVAAAATPDDLQELLKAGVDGLPELKPSSTNTTTTVSTTTSSTTTTTLPYPEFPPTTGQLGIHQLQRQPKGMEVWQGMGPPLCKAVDRIDQIIAMYYATPEHLRPWLRMFFRKYHADEGSFRYDAEKAAFWIPYSAGDLANELKAAGVPTNQVWVLGLNEVWEHNYDNNIHTINFDLRALKELAAFNRREGTSFKYAASSMAVGNPQRPDEGGGERIWQAILPLARALAEFEYNDENGECCLVSHAYGICAKLHPEWLAEYGPWLQHRWMYGYDWLKAQGVPVPFALLEGGHVVGEVNTGVSSFLGNLLAAAANQYEYAVSIPSKGIVIRLKKRRLPVVRPRGITRALGMWLNPGHGWVGEIPADRAVRELVAEFDEPVRLKNAQNGYKACYGLSPFQFGNDTDWRYFNHEELVEPLVVALRARYDQLRLSAVADGQLGHRT